MLACNSTNCKRLGHMCRPTREFVRLNDTVLFKQQTLHLQNCTNLQRSLCRHLLLCALTGQRACENVWANVRGRVAALGEWSDCVTQAPLLTSSLSPPGLVYLLYLIQIILFVAVALGNTSPLGQGREKNGSWGDEWRPRERKRGGGRDGPRSSRKQDHSLGQQTETPPSLAPHTWEWDSQNSLLPALSSPWTMGFLHFIIEKNKMRWLSKKMLCDDPMGFFGLSLFPKMQYGCITKDIQSNVYITFFLYFYIFLYF